MSPGASVAALIAFLVIVWEIWFFLGPRRSAGAAPTPRQDFQVTVRDGIRPAVIVVETGRPVRMYCYRDVAEPPTEELAFDTLPITETLPAFETTSVDFTLGESGDYRFRCGTASGLIVAVDGGGTARANPSRGHQKHG